MKIVLASAPDVLRGYFAQCRRLLMGVGEWQSVWQLPKPQTQPGIPTEVVVFEQAKTRLKRVVTAKKSAKTKRSFSWRTPLRWASGVMLAVSVLLAAVVFLPAAYYQVFPADTQPIEATTKGTPWGGEFAQGATRQERVMPPQNEALPEGDWLVIPRIGVRTQLRATDNPEEALSKGVWWVPGYGQPGDVQLPMIVAGHRFGWQWWWQTDYWKYNSFYRLPDLEPGDLVEVISDQRKWTYELYAGEEGEDITDYEADLILYTCKFLHSPIRHFRYARLVEM